MSPSSPTSQARRVAGWVVLCLLIVVHAAWDLLLCPLGGGLNELPTYLVLAVMGVILAQPTLLAVWAVLGHARLLVRWPLALTLAVLMSYALAPGAQLNGDPESGTYGVFIFLGLFFAMQLPLRIARSQSGWTVAPPRPSPWSSEADCGQKPPAPLTESQFTVRHLLIGITLVAVVLGLAHYVFPEEGARYARYLFEALPGLFFGLPVVAILSLPALVCVWLVLAHCGPGWGCALTTSLALFPVLALLGLLFRAPAMVEIGLLLGALVVGLCVGTLATVVPLRLGGFRLIRAGGNRATD